MRNQLLLALCLGAAPLVAAQQPAPLVTHASPGKWAVVMHGGAGVIERSSMTSARDAAYRAGLDRAIHAAAKVLDANGSAVDAVEAGLNVLEDDPLFNAGKGAVFTADGKNSLDAAIMDGKTMKAGAVAGVTRTRNPISLAKAVMERSQFVMLSGEGADQFAASVGLPQVDPSYFFTEERWQSLIRYLNEEKLPIPPRPAGVPPPPTKPIAQLETPDAHKWGTTGIVVRQHCRRHHHGWPHRQTLWPHRGFAHHRRRHLRLQPILRRLRHRHWRILHPPHGSPHHLRPRAVQKYAIASRGQRCYQSPTHRYER
jgi:hypothetical protein